MKADRRSRQGMVLLASMLLALPFLLGQGCPTIDSGARFIGGAGAPVVVIHSPTLNRTVSAGELITLVYDAASPGGGTVQVSAFYDRDGTAGTGDEVTFGSGLASGSNKFTQLATASLATGPLYLGITATNSVGSTTAYAGGVITLVGGPSLSFLSPAGQMRVGVGTQVAVRIETGLTNYTYSVFYDTDGVLDGDEFTIAGGTGSTASVIETSFDTADLPIATYYVGTTVTSNAGLSTSAYADGSVTLVAGAFIQVLSPTIGLRVESGEFVQILVAANDPDQPNAMVSLFYDLDDTFGNGNDTYIAQIPQTATGWSWDTRNVPVGNYYIGAELQNGLTTPLYSYSAGPVMVGMVDEGLDEGTLINVTTPLIPLTVLDGAIFRINWRTTLQPGEGVVTVFREPDVDDDGEPDGEATRVNIVEGLDANTQHVDLDTSGLVGTFFIGATVTESSTGSTQTDYSVGTLTVIPKTFWIGALDSQLDDEGQVIHQTGPFQGATFRGHNFGDNLGSAMITADDYDGDNRKDIVMAAQFGKPFFLRNEGRGAGEAYLIYSSNQRYEGSYNVNNVGQDSMPGVIFSGIVPNPFAGDDEEFDNFARAGNSVPYTVEGNPAAPYDTEGLRSLALFPDRDNDGKAELVFGFPYCNSFSLSNQVARGTHPAPLPSLGRLENNGHFLRGGVVIVSSANPLLSSRTTLSRHFDRVLQLHEVGQVYDNMITSNLPLPQPLDFCPVTNCPGPVNEGNDVTDSYFVPNEGFFQNTQGVIDPPRLADPFEAAGLMAPNAEEVALDQLDPPAIVDDIADIAGRRFSCFSEDVDAEGNPIEPFGPWPDFGLIRVLKTGFYYDELPGLGTEPACPNPLLGAGEFYNTYCPGTRLAGALPPYGCRILGQTTSQCPSPPNCVSTANRFGYSISRSGDFLLIGAPMRTVTSADVHLPTGENSRRESGAVYMLQLKPSGTDEEDFPWSLPEEAQSNRIPAPLNFIIGDGGYSRCGTSAFNYVPGDIQFEMEHPFYIVGGHPGDRVGNVTGLYDINNDGVDDFAVAAPGAFRQPYGSSPRGAVYVIYRRHPEIESDYLLEDLERDPNSDPARLNGMVIVGETGETLGYALGGGGPLNDDYNNDGHADLLIGCADAVTARGAKSGEVFILFGGRNLLNPIGGSTIAELRAAGDGMLIIGANPGDRTGTTVANAGDFNADNIPDILIAAPNASPQFDSDDDGNPDTIGLDLDGDNVADDLDQDGTPDDLTGAGLVYVVFGGEHLTGTISLDLIGTEYLPGVTIVGRKAGDALGGGLTQNGLLSNGVSPAGDLDGDGRADLMISSILADPEGKTDAGEVYLIYGFRP